MKGGQALRFPWPAATLPVLLGAAVLVLGGLAWSAARSAAAMADRRERVQSLRDEDQDELLRKQLRFLAMEPAQQDRLTKLDRQLQADPQAAHLRDVMAHYDRWLLALPSYRRAELVQLEPQERIKRVKGLLDEQAKNEAKKVNPQDTEGLLHWIDQYAAAHEQPLLASLVVSDTVRQHLAQLPPPTRYRVLFGLTWRQWQNATLPRPPLISEQDLADLRAALTPETRKRLENRTPSEQRTQLFTWLRQITHQHLLAGGAKFLAPAVDEEQLAHFFERDLTPEQRERLLNLPEEDMLRDLRQMYSVSKQGGEGFLRPDRPLKGKKADPNHPGKGKRYGREQGPKATLPSPPNS